MDETLCNHCRQPEKKCYCPAGFDSTPEQRKAYRAEVYRKFREQICPRCDAAMKDRPKREWIAHMNKHLGDDWDRRRGVLPMYFWRDIPQMYGPAWDPHR